MPLTRYNTSRSKDNATYKRDHIHAVEPIFLKRTIGNKSTQYDRYGFHN